MQDCRVWICRVKASSNIAHRSELPSSVIFGFPRTWFTWRGHGQLKLTRSSTRTRPVCAWLVWTRGGWVATLYRWGEILSPEEECDYQTQVPGSAIPPFNVSYLYYLLSYSRNRWSHNSTGCLQKHGIIRAVNENFMKRRPWCISSLMWRHPDMLCQKCIRSSV